MVKPDKKLKKILFMLGITGAVYGGFKYLLPLVVPFLLAWLTALCLRPSVRFLERRLKVRWKGKTRTLPAGVIGGMELLLLFAVLFMAVQWGGRLFISQFRLFTARIPEWFSTLDSWLTQGCRNLEGILGLKEDYLVETVRDMLNHLGTAARQSTMPLLMNNSMTALRLIVQWIVFFVLYFASVLLCLQEMEEIRERKSRSSFHREISLIGRRLAAVGNAWVKTQLIIMLITSLLYIVGLTLIGNPYSVLFGVGIGLLDALPVFGTGSVLIPWGILLLVKKSWGKAAVILGLYVICYFLRQVMEAKIMGSQVGLSALETLMSMYVGLELFGIAGFLLGPVGLLMIEDLFHLYCGEE